MAALHFCQDAFRVNLTMPALHSQLRSAANREQLLCCGATMTSGRLGLPTPFSPSTRSRPRLPNPEAYCCWAPDASGRWAWLVAEGCASGSHDFSEPPQLGAALLLGAVSSGLLAVS